MSSAWESKERVLRALDSWGSRLTIVAFTLPAVTFLLAHWGYAGGTVSEGWKDILDTTASILTVLAAATSVAWGMRRLTRRPPGFAPPRSRIPEPERNHPAGLVFLSESLVGFPKFRFFVPIQDDLELFIRASEEDPNVQEESGLDTVERTLLYESWYSFNPHCFLVMQRAESIGSGWKEVALSIILPIPAKLLQRLRDERIKVVQIRGENLTPDPGETVRTLLYDTLIFDKSFRESFSEFKKWHTLLHFAQFEPPSPGHAVTVLIEPDNPLLQLSFQCGRYGPHKTFLLHGGHTMREFTLPVDASGHARVRNFQENWQLLCKKHWPVPIGRH